MRPRRPRFRTTYARLVRRVLGDARARRREIEFRRELAELEAQLPGGEQGLGLVSLRRTVDSDAVEDDRARR